MHKTTCTYELSQAQETGLLKIVFHRKNKIPSRARNAG